MGALPFLGIMVGVFCGCTIVILFSIFQFKPKFLKTGTLVPEERLIPMMLGGVLLPAGMFWFGWTSNPHITWIAEALSGSFLGAGILLIFLQVRSVCVEDHGIDGIGS